MAMSRREFLEVLALGCAAGLTLDHRPALAGSKGAQLYDAAPFGNVSLLHFTDCHAQLLPIYFREPHANIGSGESAGRPPHLVGERLLKRFGIKPHSAQAYAFSHLDFVQAAQRYGKVGGFAHLATLVRQLRAERPGALLLDGGDTWQGSATALWTNGQDMVDACKLLGVDVMTGHWEFTLGAARVTQLVENELQGKIEFLAQNIRSADFGDPVFQPYTLRELNGVLVAVIGQAFPYTPIANPAHKIPDWTFGIEEESLQKRVDEVRGKGARVVALLSHNGVDVDLKLASRVSGIDVIFGGHTHDAIPQPLAVTNAGGKTLVTNAGCNGKFLAVMDLQVSGGKVSAYRYRLLPVFSELLEPDRAMQALIAAQRAPFEARLTKKLAVTEGLLYRRGNFTGTFDQLILDALLKVLDAEIAFTSGFRWGTALLPGDSITYEDLMAQTAITYPATEVNELSGQEIKATLEDKADNLFNPDPYYQQGGDMLRVGGLTYTLAPRQTIGKRVSRLMLNGKPLAAAKKYRVASWASLAEHAAGAPIWNVVAQYLREEKRVKALTPNVPRLAGVALDNPPLQSLFDRVYTRDGCV